MQPSLYLIDTFSLLFQVYHAIPQMTGPAGQPTNAVFGFTRDILMILKQKNPDYLLCAIDSEGAGIRKDWYPDYKVHRTEMPEDMIPQIPMLTQVIEAFGIPVVKHAGWEADDVIATLARQAERAGLQVNIVSSDKDCRQLLSENVRMFNCRKGEYYGIEELKETWGIRPDQVIDFQSLVGDSVDNVPGVPLVGPKKATSLLEQFGSLEGVLANAERAPGKKLQENLLKYAELARISQKLVTLRTDLPLDFDLELARVGNMDRDRLQKLFLDYGFRKFREELYSLDQEMLGTPTQQKSQKGQQKSLFAGIDVAPAQAKKTQTAPNSPTSTDPAGLLELVPELSEKGAAEKNGSEKSAEEKTESRNSFSEGRAWKIVRTEEELTELMAKLAGYREVFLDLETTSLDAMQAEIVGWAVSVEPGLAYYIPVMGPAGEVLLEGELVLESFRPLLEDPNIAISNQNVKYDLLVLKRQGVEVQTIGLDSMVAHYLLDAGARSHGLNSLADEFLRHRMIPITELIGTGKQQKKMDEIPVELVAEYASEDADAALQISRILQERLQQEDLWELYQDVERPLISVLAEMEFQGIRVDAEELKRQSVEVGKRVDELLQELRESTHQSFNPDSPKQLQEVLFGELGLPVQKKTKTGASTDQSVLEKLAPLHPLPAKIIEYRQLAKLKGTYLDALPKMIHPVTGRIHASFNQVVAATGRLSSSDPNLQNIPIRTFEGRQIRKAFVAGAPGWELLCCDYSQIELRVLAHFSEDEALLEAFRLGKDIHTAVAAEVFEVEESEVNSEMRRVAKAVNFGVIYGQSAFGLSEALGIPRDQASEFIEEYFARYSGVTRFIEKTLEECVRTGYAYTILKRRRPIEGIKNTTGLNRNLPERTAINTVIQGSAADMIKLAMLKVQNRLRDSGLSGKMLLQIHDELVFESPKEELEELSQLVREEMVQALALNVPIVVDIQHAENWLDAK